MGDKHIVIVGGGLAGLSAGCYALHSGYRTTIVEHNLALGGVCTAWPRGDYLVDGCIHWLTGGPFQRVYEELEILPEVKLRTLDTSGPRAERATPSRKTRSANKRCRGWSRIFPRFARRCA